MIRPSCLEQFGMAIRDRFTSSRVAYLAHSYGLRTR